MCKKNIEKTSDNYMETKDHSRVQIDIERPYINYKNAIIKTICVCICVIILSFLAAIFLKINIKNNRMLFAGILTFNGIIIFVLHLKYILIWMIRVYQSTAKIEIRLRCCYEPSCSEYAILALKKYGLIKGSIKAVKRLSRCAPPGGIDYP